MVQMAGGTLVRRILFSAIAVVMGCLIGCGGGGSSSSSGSASSSSSSSSSQTIASAAANVATLVVDCGPATICSSDAPDVNLAFVDVTVCVPTAPTDCQTFDHIQVDTQSYGLRILADATDVDGNALSIPLTAETQDGDQPNPGEPLAECAVFADGYSWGPLATAIVTISGETTSLALPVQVIGASAYTSAPSDCQTASVNNPENTVATFGANGIIGVGPFVQDCGSICADGGTATTYYYTCSTPTSCTEVTVDVNQQATNPVAYFPVDSNGVIVELPSVASAGATSATGALVFGIGTESNNGIGNASVFGADPSTGAISTTFNGQSLTDSVLDSGSNGYFFNDGSITQCSGNSGFTGFYCPTSTLSLSATIEGCSGCSSTGSTDVGFSVGDPQNFLATVAAADDLAGPVGTGLAEPGGVFDWGLTFYFGRNVFTAISGMNTPVGEGPYYAF